MDWRESAMVFVAAAVATWVGCFAAYRLLKSMGVMDVPNARSSHNLPVVRGGGLAIMVVVLSWLVWTGREEPAAWWLAAGLVLIAGISFVDDMRSLPFWLRLGVHGAAAGLAIAGLAQGSGEALGGWMGWAAAAVMWVWMVGYTNGFNFMDGINGLAAMQALAAGLFGAILCGVVGSEGGEGISLRGVIGLQVVLAGAAAGFLPHNFPRARMFLGDVGSVSMGFLLAAIVVAAWQTCGWKAGMAIGALHLNFLMDTAITMTRRAMRGERVHEAHKEHFYQRLHRAGQAHTAVTGKEGALQVAAGLVLLASVGQATPVFATALVLIAAGWGAFFLYCEGRFRAAA